MQEVEEVADYTMDVDCGFNPIFEGLTFVIKLALAIPFKEKQRLASLITQHGGNICYVVNKQTNYLVTSPGGSHLGGWPQAVRYGVPLVSPQFIEACLKAGEVVPHLPYSINPNDIQQKEEEIQQVVRWNGIEEEQPKKEKEKEGMLDDDDLLDLAEYSEEEEEEKPGNTAPPPASGDAFSSRTEWRDLLLAPELLRAIADCGWEWPSLVQSEVLPNALIGSDIICQSLPGSGKTAVFTVPIVQRLVSNSGAQQGSVKALILCSTRELVYQVHNDVQRLAKYQPSIKSAVFAGGSPISTDKQVLRDPPAICVGSPGRVLALLKEGQMVLDACEVFVMDECDDLLGSAKDDLAAIAKFFGKSNPQVIMTATTLNSDTLQTCKELCKTPFVYPQHHPTDFSKLVSHSIRQFQTTLDESKKNRKLTELLDALEFQQVIIFVGSVQRAIALNGFLVDQNFPSQVVHSSQSMTDRVNTLKQFQEFRARILVATPMYSRGLDFERVSLVINYDCPEEATSYIHRMGRTGRFGQSGLVITFVSSRSDEAVINAVMRQLVVRIPELPENLGAIMSM